MRRYTGIQPQYFPRLHYFARIVATDVFMIRDDVQFVRKHKYPDGKTGKSYQADTPIKQASGIDFLTIPTKHNGLTPLWKTEIANHQNWQENHIKTLQFTYGKARNFINLYPQLEELILSLNKNLTNLTIRTILWGLLYLLEETAITDHTLTIDHVNAVLKKQKLFRLSEIRLGSQSKALQKGIDNPNEKIIALCKEVGAEEDYCGGTAIAAYMDQDLMEQNGIKIVVQNWQCGEYPQLFAKQTGFIPNLSIIDLLMNCSINQAIEVLKG